MKNSALSLSVALLFLSLVTRSAHCQSSVSGRVQEATGKPVSYANVVLLAAHDSSLVKAAMSGETGTFILETAGPGRYLLCVSMLGYLPHYALLQVSGSGQALNMGTIHLKESSQHLAEVVVETSKMLYEQKIDRLVMNVASSPVLVGGTAWDVLKRSPGLTVDEVRGSITMNGKNGVLVLINGKPRLGFVSGGALRAHLRRSPVLAASTQARLLPSFR